MATGRQRTLLIADDDEDLSRVLIRAFTSLGWNVHAARTGTEAVALASSEPGIDAAIVDLVLPGAGGLDVVRQLRESHPGCRIVALTGLGTNAVRDAFARAGAHQFLVKPVDLDVLVAAVSG